MKYYLDTEFIEGRQDKKFLGIKYGQTPFTIDLISIGIVGEDGREYYAISKDFNLREAWSRYDLKPCINSGGMKKVYWIKENVLKPIWLDLFEQHGKYVNDGDAEYAWDETKDYIKYIYLKLLLLKYGKSNEQIAKEVAAFCTVNENRGNSILELVKGFKDNTNREISFYGYYSDYDWVVFCSLFGKMIDLPKGFPMMMMDIQQQIEEYKIDKNKLLSEIPQRNCHNALVDAIWNKMAYNWIKNEIKYRNNK